MQSATSTFRVKICVANASEVKVMVVRTGVMQHQFVVFAPFEGKGVRDELHFFIGSAQAHLDLNCFGAVTFFSRPQREVAHNRIINTANI